MTREFHNLPPLTDKQADAIVALANCGSLVEASARAGMSYGEFVDCLSSEEARAHLAASRTIAEERARARIADAAHTAAEALERIAENPDSPLARGCADPADAVHLLTERRRAATTLIRAFQAPRTHHRRRTLTSSDVTSLLNRLLTTTTSNNERDRKSESASSPVLTGEVSLESATMTEGARSSPDNSDDPMTPSTPEPGCHGQHSDVARVSASNDNELPACHGRHSDVARVCPPRQSASNSAARNGPANSPVPSGRGSPQQAPTAKPP